MSVTNALCFYHPTTVVIVDDNQTFLNNVVDNLNDNVKYKLFNSPQKALGFLKGHRKNFAASEDFLGHMDDPLTGKSLNVNISKIYTQINNKKRFETPTVVIIDYKMPNMSGIKFCKALSKYPIKKIMLTGVADYKLAVKAFNEGVIDKFILKSDPDVFSLIDQSIYELQREYFAAISDILIKNITMTTSSFLTNNAYQELMMQFINKNKITEFYLTDVMGSFLLRDVRGNTMILVAQSAQEIENYRQIAKDLGAPLKVLNPITNKKKLVCLFSDDDFNQSVNTWDAYLHKAHTSKHIKDLYYAVLREKIATKTMKALVA